MEDIFLVDKLQSLDHLEGPVHDMIHSVGEVSSLVENWGSEGGRMILTSLLHVCTQIRCNYLHFN